MTKRLYQTRSDVTNNPAILAICLVLLLFGGSLEAQEIRLRWDPNSEPDLAGYNIYRSQVSGSGYARLNGSLIPINSFTDSSVQADVTYYYVATSVKEHGLESAFSDEVSASASGTSGLVASFGFEEGNGITTADASGNGNDGTLVGPAWTGGYFGNALSLDGSDDYVQVADHSTLDMTSEFTIAVWIYPQSLAGNQTIRTILNKSNSGSPNYYLSVALLHNSGRVTDRSQSCLNAIEFALTQACPDLAYDSAPHI